MLLFIMHTLFVCYFHLLEAAHNLTFEIILLQSSTSTEELFKTKLTILAQLGEVHINKECEKESIKSKNTKMLALGIWIV